MLQVTSITGLSPSKRPETGESDGCPITPAAEQTAWTSRRQINQINSKMMNVFLEFLGLGDRISTSK
ncbi:hypothetical protein RRG08_033274 [Elysia crispata]|uniref:Uncharacterized protein n=1 Tax=Elysia crispata TaxID=231223 RepID=A0AAE1CKY9_9GAST|nr:hypothetical protein RRG08_033274 [Elysia crispata]